MDDWNLNDIHAIYWNTRCILTFCVELLPQMVETWMNYQLVSDNKCNIVHLLMSFYIFILQGMTNNDTFIW